MERENEYHDSMIAMLELVWGEGFMAPGGEGNVAKRVDGLELDGRPARVRERDIRPGPELRRRNTDDPPRA